MDRGPILHVYLPALVGLLAIAEIFRAAPPPHAVLRLLGLLLAVIGLAGVILARHTLGRSFSWVPKATGLVTTGIYSRIRNPIYVSGLFLVVGVSLMLRRPEMLAIIAVLIPMQIFRARKEAGVLEAKFGEAYREYRKRTWF
ncbi:MAG: isoprenylcysteine carboxylmethyltransferase family protein [Terriglobales bacterium]|jgi:protein-S-isoprenylcysteine O-methyltransferase Ste14